MGKIIDLSGKKFGRWTVLQTSQKIFPYPDSKYFYVQWQCRCECGVVRFVNGKALRSGRSASCGHDTEAKRCAAVTSHGASYTRLYNIWRGMKARCQNPKDTGYQNYGGRGIAVCDRWQSFANFRADMGEAYRDGLTIERNDNDGDYEPGNCCWIPKGEQMKNRRPASQWRNARAA
jgi:hypothetical protein